MRIGWKKTVGAKIGPHPGIVAAKIEARKLARVRRAVLHAGANATGLGEAYRKAADHFFAKFSPKTGDVVAAYLPVGHEFDIRPILKRLTAWGVVSALPVVVAEKAPLQFRVWRPGEPLESGAHNIMAPTTSANEVKPDIVLVPLIAFDMTGSRLGQGGGYYDRTISQLRQEKASVKIVGLAFDGQMMDAVPHDVLDARLDAVVTETGCYSFTSTGGA